MLRPYIYIFVEMVIASARYRRNFRRPILCPAILYNLLEIIVYKATVKKPVFIMSWRYLKGITQLVFCRYRSKDSFVYLSGKGFFYRKERKLARWCDLMMRWLNKWITSHRVESWLMWCFWIVSGQRCEDHRQKRRAIAVKASKVIAVPVKAKEKQQQQQPIDVLEEELYNVF